MLRPWPWADATAHPLLDEHPDVPPKRLHLCSRFELAGENSSNGSSTRGGAVISPSSGGRPWHHGATRPREGDGWRRRRRHGGGTASWERRRGDARVDHGWSTAIGGYACRCTGASPGCSLPPPSSLFLSLNEHIRGRTSLSLSLPLSLHLPLSLSLSQRAHQRAHRRISTFAGAAVACHAPPGRPAVATAGYDNVEQLASAHTADYSSPYLIHFCLYFLS